MYSGIHYHPTHEHQGFRYRRGHTLPFGATPVRNGVNFSIFSSAATGCTLVLFLKGEPDPLVEIDFPPEFRLGNVYSMIVSNLDYETVEYGFRFDGPWDPARGHRFDRSKILCDPYARAVGGRDVWGVEPDWNSIYSHRGRIVTESFDWEDDRPLETPIEQLVIYEMHVRGFTQHPSSGVSAPGTYSGLCEKIPYLKSLGVNCVELLPVFEFDEWENHYLRPDQAGARSNAANGSGNGWGERLPNYWGYSTLGFFAPKAGYAASGAVGRQMDEFKRLIKSLHAAGIEVILDVVFNHTAEGDERGRYISFRGIDNRMYYMLTADGRYFNFSGTGNTLNCNHPVVRNMVLDCLRYWACEYHVDGFRFDLASILGRDQQGTPLANPPLLETLAADPVLAKCKLIAEAWDAGGLYQVGSFPAYGRWAEWNGRFRDAVRQFVKGDEGMTGEIALRITGSPDLYHHRGPAASINFVTCHDGFTLRDLFSYNTKHNDANGEDNQDGLNENDSWNCGYEGDTHDPEVNALRGRLTRNALALLLLSRGVPMLLAGDEAGRTQRGNNNAYCQDNEISWFNWDVAARNAGLTRFVRGLIRLRRENAVVRGTRFFHAGQPDEGALGSDLEFLGTDAGAPDFSAGSRCLAFRLLGRASSSERSSTSVDQAGRRGPAARPSPASDIYVAMNLYWEPISFRLPDAGHGQAWRLFANTASFPPSDIFDPGDEPAVTVPDVVVSPRSLVILVTKPSVAQTRSHKQK